MNNRHGRRGVVVVVVVAAWEEEMGDEVQAEEFQLHYRAHRAAEGEVVGTVGETR